jgi:formylglycine-generating enzyme required for sulfatase activity
MDINVRIEIGLPRWVARGLVLAGIPLLLAFGLSALARADTVSPVQFADGETLTAKKLNDNLNALAAAINAPSPDCPAGYAKSGAAAAFLTNSIVCKKGKDEVVKVGTGASAFWIDRYEASAWTTPDASTGQIADNDDTAYGVAGLPKNGQGSGVFALAVANVAPARQMTWFQAVEMCAASGKQVPDGQQWIRAARGTFDPVAPNDGALSSRCNTGAGAGAPRKTGLAVGSATDKTGACVSDWGAEDMIGNVWEWTAEWFVAPGVPSYDVNAAAKNWPTGFNQDATWNIGSNVYNGTVTVGGLPAGSMRGGYWGDGTSAGLFSMYIRDAPSEDGAGTGLRCAITNR